jgi:hypothetical protein
VPFTLDIFIRGVDHPSDLGRERQERDDVLPGVAPGPDHGREPLSPLGLKRVEGVQRAVGIDRGVDHPQILDHGVVVAARDIAQRGADEVHDARLHRGQREDRLDRLGEPLKAIHAADQDVFDATVAQLAEDLHPELGALGVLKPHAEHVAVPVDPDPQRQIARAALHRPAVADLEHHAVQEHDRVEVLKRAGLPLPDVIHDRVGDPADEIAAHADAVELSQVRFDIPRGHPPAIERQDPLVKPLKPPLTLAHQLGLKAAIAIPRRPDLDRPVLGAQRLGRRPVALIARPARRLPMMLVSEVVSQLDLESALHQPLGQLRQQPTRPDDLLLSPRSCQQLVHDIVRQLATDLIGHAVQDPRRGRRLAWRLAGAHPAWGTAPSFN